MKSSHPVRPFFMQIRVIGTLITPVCLSILLVMLSSSVVLAGPPVTVTPTSLDFHNQAVGITSLNQTLSIKNNLASTITNLSTNISVTGDFTRNGGSCGASLTAGSTCTLFINFLPTATGTRNGNVTYTSALGTVSVPVTGTGVNLLPINLRLYGSGSVGMAVQVSGTGNPPETAPACTNDCSRSFYPADIIRLTATTTPDNIFVGWSGACSGTSPCDVTMDGAIDVKAQFIPNALTVTKTGGGSGTVSYSGPPAIDCGTTCSASYNVGTIFSLTATPAAGSYLTNWGGSCTPFNIIYCTVTMDSPKTIVANFEPNTLSVGVTGNGSVNSSPAGISCGSTCNYNFNYGQSVTLNTFAAAGHVLKTYGGACLGTPSYSSNCSLTMNAAKSASMEFVPNVLTLNLSGNGSGTITLTSGSLDCSSGTCQKSYTGIQSETIQANAIPGSAFDHWEGDCTGTSSSCSLSMDGSKTATAFFKGPVAVLTPAAEDFGNTTVYSNSIKTFTLSNSGDYALQVTAVDINGSNKSDFMPQNNGTCGALPWNLSPAASCTFDVKFTPTSSGTKNATLTTVSLAKNNPAITLSGTGSGGLLQVVIAGNGSGSIALSSPGPVCSANCSQVYPGGSATLTPTASPGSTFLRWDGDCAGSGTCSPGMTSNRKVYAYFSTLPAITVENAKMMRGSTGTAEMVFKVYLSSMVETPVTVNYSTSDGTAVAGTDYASTSGMITFPAATRAQTIHVTINGQAQQQPDRMFTLNLINPVGATISMGTATGTITSAPAFSFDYPVPLHQVNADNVSIYPGQRIVLADINGDGYADLLTDRGAFAINRGDGSFVEPILFTTLLNNGATAPADLASGDLNGDGKADVVLSHYGSGRGVHVFSNFSNGSFLSATQLSDILSTDPKGVAIGDFNGDGKNDIAVVHGTDVNSNGTVKVFFNNGDGTFSLNGTYPACIGADRIVAADFFKTGRHSLAVTCSNNPPGSVALLINSGSGTFANPLSFTVENNPVSIAAADVNGDGLIDLVVGNYDSKSVSVLIKKASGTFNQAVSYPVNTNPYNLIAADIDGDGYPDIVSNTIGATSVLLNLRNGTFSPPRMLPSLSDASYGIAAADIDHDGDVDIVLQKTISSGSFYLSDFSVFYNSRFDDSLFMKRSSVFQATAKYSGLLDGALFAADVDHDGKQDLLAFSNTWVQSLILANGPRSFSSPAPFNNGFSGLPTTNALCKLNNDNYLDITNLSGNQLYFNVGNAAGGLTWSMTTNSYGPMAFVTCGDVNGDGYNDLVTPGSIEGISVFLNNHSGGVSAPNWSPFSFNPGGTNTTRKESKLIDLDGDGFPELVFTDFNEITVIKNNGGNFDFAAPTHYPFATTPRALASGDFNKDGYADLAVVLESSNSIAVMLNNGDGTFRTPLVTSVAAAPHTLSAVDLDQDGDLDLVVGHLHGPMELLINNGSGEFIRLGRTISLPGTYWTHEALLGADLDGDGAADLAVYQAVPQSGGATTDNNWYHVFWNNIGGSQTRLDTTSLSPATVKSGQASTLTVNLDRQATQATTVQLYSSRESCVSVPASITIPAGSASNSLLVTPNSDCAGQTITLTARLGSSIEGAGLAVSPIVVQNVVINPASITGGDDCEATITLSVPAGAGGKTVDLQTSNGLLTFATTGAFWATLSIPAGSQTGTMTLHSQPTNTNASITITAGTADGSAQNSVTLLPVVGTAQLSPFVVPTGIAGPGQKSLALADINHDGTIDMVLTDAYGQMRTALNDGNGTFTASSPSASVLNTGTLATADFNGDGVQDVVSIAYYGTTASTLLNNGDGTFSPPANYTPAGAQRLNDLVTGDFNGDGKIDFAVIDSWPLSNKGVTVYLNNGAGGFTAVQSPSLSISGEYIAKGDFDKDGKLDLVVANYSSFTILTGNGDGTFTNSGTVNMIPAQSYSDMILGIAVADLNADTFPDIAVSVSTENSNQRRIEVRTYQNNGYGAFTEKRRIDIPFTHSTSRSWFIPIIATDLNGDGYPDIAVAHSEYSSAGTTDVLINNGSGIFSAPYSFAGGIGPVSIAAADIDGDGDKDLVVAYSDGAARIYTNNLVTPPADLAVTMNDSPDPVAANGILTYTATITNNGPNPAKAVNLTGSVPAGASFVSATSGQGTCSQATGIVTCTIGDMASAATVTVSIVVTAPASAGPVSSTATVASSTTDPNLANNGVTQNTIVNPPLRLLQVTVTATGTAEGTVTSSSQTTVGVPGDISCNNGTCSASYPDSSTVRVEALPSWCSSFGGWTGCTSATRTCDVVMNGSKTVSAAFSLIPDQVLVYGDTGYNSFSSAISALSGNGSIMAKGSYSNALAETMLFNHGYTVSLFGGLSDLWATVGGMSHIKGSLSIRNGRINVNGIALHP
jgi:uncharacterized repeat protein (TIGR01451 family)